MTERPECQKAPPHFFSASMPARYNMLAVPDLRILISEQKISNRVSDIGREITQDLSGQSVIFVGVLKGAAIFLSDLIRKVELDAAFDFIGVSSYGNRPTPAQELSTGWDSTGEVRLTKDVDQSLIGRNVILVEDILDTGLTLTFLKTILHARHPKSLRVATLLDKPSRRLQPVEADYVGFSIADEFVVGYGMDYAERYRNVPDIRVVPRS